MPFLETETLELDFRRPYRYYVIYRDREIQFYLSISKNSKKNMAARGSNFQQSPFLGLLAKLYLINVS